MYLANTVYPQSSHNTDIVSLILFYSSIVFLGRAILKELIFRITLAAGAIFTPIYRPSSTARIQASVDPALLGLYRARIHPVEPIQENIAQLSERVKWNPMFPTANVTIY